MVARERDLGLMSRPKIIEARGGTHGLVLPDKTTPQRLFLDPCKKVQVGKDQEKAQSERDSHSKNRGGKKPN